VWLTQLHISFKSFISKKMLRFVLITSLLFFSNDAARTRLHTNADATTTFMRTANGPAAFVNIISAEAECLSYKGYAVIKRDCAKVNVFGFLYGGGKQDAQGIRKLLHGGGVAALVALNGAKLCVIQDYNAGVFPADSRQVHGTYITPACMSPAAAVAKSSDCRLWVSMGARSMRMHDSRGGSMVAVKGAQWAWLHSFFLPALYFKDTRGFRLVQVSNVFRPQWDDSQSYLGDVVDDDDYTFAVARSLEKPTHTNAYCTFEDDDGGVLDVDGVEHKAVAITAEEVAYMELHHDL
jgi:hypothetical protein